MRFGVADKLHVVAHRDTHRAVADVADTHAVAGIPAVGTPAVVDMLRTPADSPAVLAVGSLLAVQHPDMLHVALDNQVEAGSLAEGDTLVEGDSLERQLAVQKHQDTAAVAALPGSRDHLADTDKPSQNLN